MIRHPLARRQKQKSTSRCQSRSAARHVPLRSKSILLACGAAKSRFASQQALPTAAIGAWRHTDKLMEDARHVRVAREAAFERDFGQRHGGCLKQLAGACHAQVQDIVVWRLSGGSPKHPREVDGAISALARQRL